MSELEDINSRLADAAQRQTHLCDVLQRQTLFFAQTANLLNLYANGYDPKDEALPLLEKIKIDYPGMLDEICGR